MTPNAQVPDGSVIITPNEQFAELRATHDEVKTLSQKMEGLTNQVGTRLVGLEQSASDHENRLRSLEKKVWGYAGAATILGMFGGVILERFPLW